MVDQAKDVPNKTDWTPATSTSPFLCFSSLTFPLPRNHRHHFTKISHFIQRKQCGCWIKAECKSRKGGRGRKPHSSFYSPSPFLFLYISLFLIVFSPALKFFFQPLLWFHQFLLSSEKEENQSWPESHHFCKGSAPHLPCEGRLGGFCIDPISSHLKDGEERRKGGA